MEIIESLLKSAYEDTQLLLKNDSLGDQFSTPRDVDFLLIAENEHKASLVCAFINDNRYGTARVEQSGEEFNITAVIRMPVEQNILCSVSGLMTCIGAIFGVEYDGWGCVLKKGG